MSRPPVSVVLPFHGGEDEAASALRALRRLRLRPGDEIVVADNTPDGVVTAAMAPGASDHAGAAEGVTVVAAPEPASSYYARNRGAEAARNEWLLFLDADTIPSPTLLDDYFADPIAAGCGAVAGELVVARDQAGLLARWAASRGHLTQAGILRHEVRPMVVTANLLVRRRAWEQLGGFLEGVRSAGDSDFAWRLQDAGWTLGHQGRAVAEHRFRTSIRGLARQFGRYGAGGAWFKRRHPDYPRPPVARRLARAAAGVVVWTLTGRFERARLKAIDGVVVAAGGLGWLMGNVAPRRVAAPRAEVVALVESFPELTETFLTGELRALRRAGMALRVEAGGRARRPAWPAARGVEARYLEDDGIARKLADMAWLAARHPLGVTRDLAARRRWRREESVWPLRSLAPVARRLARGGEPHVHAYFAAGAALNALRLARLTGVSYSVTAYAYEVFRAPANLAEKVAGARFAVTVAEEAAAELGRLADTPVHVVATGVDGEGFRRRAPHPGGRTVLGVGRLVEKKGFQHLIDAAARLGPRARVRIAGDGPLRGGLEERARRRGAEVEWLGSCDHDRVRELMEEADVVAMPCVIAADGDRDLLPNVVSEALAMEVPVVGTDVAGLPEVIRPEWGRVVPSGDAGALAAAIEALLALPPERRAELGRAGREFVLSTRDPDVEAAKLARLLRAEVRGAADPQSTNTR